MSVTQITLLVAFAFHQPSPPVLEVTNNTLDVADFRIRASDREREWTTIRLMPGDKKSIRLVSDDPFDVDVCRWSGYGYWNISEQRAIHLKDLDSGQHTLSMRRWFVTSRGKKPNQTYDYSVLRSQNADIKKQGAIVTWQIATNYFWLLERGR